MSPYSLNSNRNLNQQKIQVHKVCVYRVTIVHSNEIEPEKAHCLLDILQNYILLRVVFIEMDFPASELFPFEG